MTGRNRREATAGKGYIVANREKDSSARGKYNLILSLNHFLFN
jgi:hypothetical protein